MSDLSGAAGFIELEGLIERVTFFSQETGFCVLRVKVKSERDLVNGGGVGCLSFGG